MEVQVSYERVFRHDPEPAALLNRQFEIIDANDKFLEVTGHTLDEVIGRQLFVSLPPDPMDQSRVGRERALQSLRYVLETGETDRTEILRYDLEAPGAPGAFDEHWWTLTHRMITDKDSPEPVLLHQARDVTHLVRETEKQQLIEQ